MKFYLNLVEVQQYERAAAVAEKYCDFQLLIQICEESENADRLQRYMHQFADKVSFQNNKFNMCIDICDLLSHYVTTFVVLNFRNSVGFYLNGILIKVSINFYK